MYLTSYDTVILGMDWLVHNDARIYCANRVITLWNPRRKGRIMIALDIMSEKSDLMLCAMKDDDDEISIVIKVRTPRAFSGDKAPPLVKLHPTCLLW